MRYLLVFYCFAFLFISCKKNKVVSLENDLNSVNQKIHRMFLLDQNIRKSSEYLNFYFGKRTELGSRDSYLTDWGMSKKIDSIYYSQYNNPDMVKYLDARQLDYENEKQKHAKAMFIIDSLNTVELINITKKYGFPSYDRMKKLAKTENIQMTDKILSPVIIFVHSPSCFFDQLKKMMKKEYLKGNIDCRQCSYIFWNLNGRTSSIDFEYCKKFSKKNN